jgi:hypothetical protein
MTVSVPSWLAILILVYVIALLLPITGVMGIALGERLRGHTGPPASPPTRARPKPRRQTVGS